MKSAKLLLALAATGLVATSAFAQKSAFQGFYGQLATGYENNSTSNGNLITSDPGSTPNTWSASNQSFGGAPLVIGAGYNFSVAPKWVVGIGADYSFLPQTSSTYSASNPTNGSNDAGGTLAGATYKTSNRYNIFITPGYEIDKDKLVYLKAGYSSVSLTSNGPTSYIDNGDAMNNNTIRAGSQSKTLNGYVLGLGYKQFITGGIYGFAEGNYMSYSKANFALTDANGTSISSNPGLASYQLLVGVGYKF